MINKSKGYSLKNVHLSSKYCFIDGSVLHSSTWEIKTWKVENEYRKTHFTMTTQCLVTYEIMVRLTECWIPC